MFDVRVLKLFNANYGDKSSLGTTLIQAQNDCFQFEGYGTRISDDIRDCILSIRFNDCGLPQLGLCTTEDDYTHAQYVIQNGSMTHKSFHSYLMGEKVPAHMKQKTSACADQIVSSYQSNFAAHMKQSSYLLSYDLNDMSEKKICH